jgi:predicted PurR-regulated permease PerM
MVLTPGQWRALSWLGLSLVGAILLWLLAPVLTPFLVGAILAYALHPLVERLVRHRVPRVLSVVLVEVAVIVLLLALLLLIVPVLSKELPLLKAQIPALAEKLNQKIAPWLAQLGVQASLDVPGIKAFVVKYLGANVEEGIAALLSSARIGGSFVLALVGNVVLIPVVLFYLLMDWPRLVQRVQDFIPPRLRSAVLGFLDECDLVLGQYLRGQLLVMLLLAAYYTVALQVAGFDLALPVGIFTGLAVFIPYLGFGLGCALALLAGVLQFASLYGVIVVAVVYGFGQFVESLFLTPRLVGERIGLNPLAVIFALLAFGHLLGFVGVLVALPLSAVALVALQRLKVAYLASRLYGA